MVMRISDDDGWPLFIGHDLKDLHMALEAKAITAAGRHLHLDHGVPIEMFSDGSTIGGVLLLRLHLSAHGLDHDPYELRHALPWNVRSAVHRLAEGET